MTSLRSLIGKPAVSQSSAEDLGALGQPTIDIHARSVAAWPVGSGRKARMIDHTHINAFGEAAAMIDDEANLRDFDDAAEKAAAKGKLSVLDALVISDAGNRLGTVGDVDVDLDADGALVALTVDGEQVAADRILALGNYALVLRSDPVP
jgi:sporulation protein YlmC with PRC-barrel domain